MERCTMFFLASMACCLTLSACSPFKLSDHRAGECNQLNSDIIFNGNTSNTRLSEIQSAEAPLEQRNYDKHCEQ